MLLDTGPTHDSDRGEIGTGQMTSLVTSHSSLCCGKVAMLALEEPLVFDQIMDFKKTFSVGVGPNAHIGHL